MTATLIWKNIWYKKGNLLLSLLLFMLGTSIISLLLLVQHGINSKLDRDLKDIDVVVGAKGSPLQLVLSAVYHADAPTGNISYQKLLTATKGPLVEQVIPLAYGDTYRGYRILGTTKDYIDKYNGALAKGSLFGKPLEAVLGSQVAATSGLGIDSNFVGTHGEEGETHDEHAYRVTGILQPTGTVLDYLVLTDVATVWEVHHHEEDHTDSSHAHDAEPHQHHDGDKHHEEGDHAHEADNAKHKDDHDHDDSKKDHQHNEKEGDHKHGEKDHDHHHEEGEHEEEEDQEITAALIKFRSPMATISFPRIINAQTNFQAVNPTLEINRLQGLMSIGAGTLQAVALVIMVVSVVSVFVVLYTRLKERRYELALMRLMGAGRMLLAGLLLAEGICLALLGTIAGLLLSRGILAFLLSQGGISSQIPFTFALLPGEWLLVCISLFAGLIAAIIPAVQAYRLHISKTLSHG